MLRNRRVPLNTPLLVLVIRPWDSENGSGQYNWFIAAMMNFNFLLEIDRGRFNAGMGLYPDPSPTKIPGTETLPYTIFFFFF